ncbi:hypothetical protein SAMN05421666_2252 [Roseovarius nanhaiticus]|uniref:Uncharacterized protein n=1 Tax=Roseovarius nanhaiticus TaxID=573024 RepID=A0A1N7GZ82_9RHOB|nr:hypothetical protein [Roseovarius nanhaiticus]SEL19312.1 hypothetical protein SAMN05216208_3067 [Roseovarius nanhaiticus]SIS17758.1 hypothetical protein SAMN05421666_2252 [Roseovarius nanhaiticus]
MKKAMMIAAALFVLSGGAFAGENGVEPGMEAEFPGARPIAPSRSSQGSGAVRMTGLSPAVHALRVDRAARQRQALAARQRARMALMSAARSNAMASGGRWMMVGAYSVWVPAPVMQNIPRY